MNVMERGNIFCLCQALNSGVPVHNLVTILLGYFVKVKEGKILPFHDMKMCRMWLEV